MTPYHAGQIALALGVSGYAAVRAREILFRAPVVPAPVVEALDEALARGERARAHEIATRALPSWVGRVATAALAADGEGAVLEALDDTLAALTAEALRGRAVLRVLASVASAVGLIGAILELGGAFRDPLLALAPGLAQKVALGHALSSMAIGLSTAFVAVVARSTLGRNADRTLAGANMAASRLAVALRALPGAEPSPTAVVQPVEAKP